MNHRSSRAVTVAFAAAVGLTNCAAATTTADPPAAVHASSNPPTATDLASNAVCVPRLGASCATDSDCPQCALVAPRTGPGEVFVATSVQCIHSVCTKTGCPIARCPEGQYCQGCGANLPCMCRPGPMPANGG